MGCCHIISRRQRVNSRIMWMNCQGEVEAWKTISWPQSHGMSIPNLSFLLQIRCSHRKPRHCTQSLFVRTSLFRQVFIYHSNNFEFTVIFYLNCFICIIVTVLNCLIPWNRLMGNPWLFSKPKYGQAALLPCFNTFLTFRIGCPIHAIW